MTSLVACELGEMGHLESYIGTPGNTIRVPGLGGGQDTASRLKSFV